MHAHASRLKFGNPTAFPQTSPHTALRYAPGARLPGAHHDLAIRLLIDATREGRGYRVSAGEDMHLAFCFFAPVGLNTRGELASASELHHRDGCDASTPSDTTLSLLHP